MYPDNFKKYGMNFTKIAENTKAVMYSQKLNSKIVAYEVHRKNKAKELAGKSAFGYRGWSYEKITNAAEKFKELSILSN